MGDTGAERMDSGYYTAKEAASLTGVPLSTLHYWVRTGLVEPSQALARPMLFSFLDLRDLVVINRLRKADATMHAVRRGVDWLRNVADVRHIVQADCIVQDGEVVWRIPGEQRRAVVVSQGGQVCFTLADVYAELNAEVVDGQVVSLHPAPDVTIDPDVRGGTPVVTGTRIPTSLIMELLEDGLTPAEVSKLYPAVKPAQVRAVAEWEKRRHVAA